MPPTRLSMPVPGSKALIWKAGYRRPHCPLSLKTTCWTTIGSSVRRYHRHEELPLWSAVAHDAVREAWRTGAPAMPQLAKNTGISEDAIARDLVHSGLAADLVAIGDRLGCSAGTHPARRDSWQKATCLYVLAVADPATKQRISVHPDIQAAADLRDIMAPIVWHITRVDSTDPAGGGEVVDHSPQRPEQ